MPRRNLMAPAARRPASFRTPAVVQQLVHRPCQPVQRVSRHQTEMFITVCILDNRQLCSGNSRSFTQGGAYEPAPDTSTGLPACRRRRAGAVGPRMPAVAGRQRPVVECPGRRRFRLLQGAARQRRSEEHTSELQPQMRISYAVFCLKKKQQNTDKTNPTMTTYHYLQLCRDT